MDALLSVNEAAKRLGGISPWTVRVWLTQKRLPRTKVGSRTFVRASAIDAFIAQCNQPDESTAA
jgi:excisionase family DNA binding protein